MIEEVICEKGADLNGFLFFFEKEEEEELEFFEKIVTRFVVFVNRSNFV